MKTRIQLGVAIQDTLRRIVIDMEGVAFFPSLPRPWEALWFGGELQLVVERVYYESQSSTPNSEPIFRPNLVCKLGGNWGTGPLADTAEWLYNEVVPLLEREGMTVSNHTDRALS